MIYTHSGVFHADDVFAVALLDWLRWFGSADRALVRTRDAAALARFDPAHDVMVDVGGACDPAARRFDHHFPDPPRRDDGIPYAAFGLSWRAFGAAYVRHVIDPGHVHPEGLIAEVADRVERELVRTIDAGDTGTALVADPTPAFAGITPFSIAKAVAAWNAPDTDDHAAQGHCFRTAVRWAFQLLERVVRRAADQVTALVVVREAVEAHLARIDDDFLPEVLLLDESGPWQEVVLGDARCKDVLYVVFPAGGDWLVQCIPDAVGSFGKRRPLPEAWSGLRDGAFVAASGVADAVFCHPGRFICGARSLAGAIALAGCATA